MTKWQKKKQLAIYVSTDILDMSVTNSYHPSKRFWNNIERNREKSFN